MKQLPLLKRVGILEVDFMKENPKFKIGTKFLFKEGCFKVSEIKEINGRMSYKLKKL